jgi:DNA-binding response OmpR family regulator
MDDTMSLEGRSVLVVDDDFVLAMDARSTLEEAGATVVEPFGSADHALASLQEHHPDIAVVDLNLGSGLSFDLVQALLDQGVSTLIVTGYDQRVVPPELAGLPYLQKPVETRQLLSSIKQLLG